MQTPSCSATLRYTLEAAKAKHPSQQKSRSRCQGATALRFDSDPVLWQGLEVTKEATLRLNPQCDTRKRSKLGKFASKRNLRNFNLPPRYHSSFVLGSFMLGSCSGSCLCLCAGGASGGRASYSRGRRSPSWRSAGTSRSALPDQSWRSDWH